VNSEGICIARPQIIAPCLRVTLSEALITRAGFVFTILMKLACLRYGTVIAFHTFLAQTVRLYIECTKAYRVSIASQSTAAVTGCVAADANFVTR